MDSAVPIYRWPTLIEVSLHCILSCLMMTMTTSYGHTHESVNDKQMVESPLRIERLYSICNTSHDFVNIHVTMSKLVLGRR